MSIASIRVYAELNDLLPRRLRGTTVLQRLDAAVAVKDLIERLGIPHTEVDLILVNGESVGFDHVLGRDARVSVFPVFESLDISEVQRVRPVPLRRPSFVLDVHLGRLARYLRMLGFDTLYDRGADDADLACLASRGRILLTQDRGLLKRKVVTHGYLVRHRRPRLQAAEVLRRFDLATSVFPFSRCLLCNAPLEVLRTGIIPHTVPPRVRERCTVFARCSGCGKVFWKGSHHRAMEGTVDAIMAHAFETRPDETASRR
ncbi:Mut7-C ubiquitin/RNAse domain-containing protein [Candidatus Fermentibacteria bacterium]|nr:Mut7-C ubiquitin/RNAse domain-containing protein [Candidatus Fermentibacteria bacterium]